MHCQRASSTSMYISVTLFATKQRFLDSLGSPKFTKTYKGKQSSYNNKSFGRSNNKHNSSFYKPASNNSPAVNVSKKKVTESKPAHHDEASELDALMLDLGIA